jgi:hypothetical protein
MHQRQQTSQLQYLLHIGPDLWILANKVGQKITTTHCFHDSGKRSIPLGHFSYGMTGLSGIISMLDGRSTLEPPECDQLHHQPIDPLGYPRTSSPDLGTSSGMATSKQSKDKSGKMHIWQQRSLLSGFHINSRRNQTRQEQTQGNPDGQSPGRHQNDQIICGIVQFLPGPHQGFHSDSCSTVQAYSEGFWIQRGSITSNSNGCIYQLQKAAHFGTGNGFSRTDWQYALITDAARGTADTPGGFRAILTQVDQDGKFYAISFASRQLKDHEKNYLPFLLKAAATVWGMDHFNKYLKGKKFILYTDHKPLQKLGHLHSKTMNQFQTALLEHDFIIQYKKGSDMPADYLSRLPATASEPIIAPFDPFQTDLAELQREEPFAQNILYFRKHNQWPPHLSKMEANSHADLFKKMFHDKEGILWV